MLFPLTTQQLTTHPVHLKSSQFDFEKTGNNIKSSVIQPVAPTPHSQLEAPPIESVKKMTGGVANISVVTNNVAMPHISTHSNTSPGATGSDDGYRNSVTSHGEGGTGDPECGSMGMNCDTGSPTPPQTLTLRLIMQGKEVGSIIGKRGDTIKKFRTESGARINISDGQSIERIVTLTGANECLNKAFAMISYKFEEDMSEGLTADCPKPPVTLRLIVPASQCGSIIGKGGSKIKEIREHTGCTIQVAGDFLPQSTERAVTISGMPEAITKCIMEICKIMAESPPKGQTIPYRPKPISSIVTGSPIIANGHHSAAALGGHPGLAATPAFSPGVPMANNFLSTAYGLHPAANHTPQFLPATAQSTHEEPVVSTLEEINLDSQSSSSCAGAQSGTETQMSGYYQPSLSLFGSDHLDSSLFNNELAKLQAAQLSSLYGSFLQPTTAMMHLGAAAAASPSAAALAAPFAATSSAPTAAGTAPTGHSNNTTQELSIPNDVIGCVIGPHGNRINDIRYKTNPRQRSNSGGVTVSSGGGASGGVTSVASPVVSTDWHGAVAESQPHLHAAHHHHHTHHQQHLQAQQNIAAAAYLNNLAAYQSAAIYWPWFISAASAYQQPPPTHSALHSGATAAAAAVQMSHHMTPAQPQHHPAPMTSHHVTSSSIANNNDVINSIHTLPPVVSATSVCATPVTTAATTSTTGSHIKMTNKNSVSQSPGLPK